uniref:Minichromosome maintenance (MCM), putative n=1 Tax=Theileria annulata TaxID=5874 RepID=A0A3B0MXK9_THEAN
MVKIRYSEDVVKLISQLYLSEQKIDFDDFLDRLDEWLSFFENHWNILIEPIKNEFFDNYVLKLDYEELLNLDVPPSVEAFKKDFYSSPELIISLISSSLHILSIYKYKNTRLVNFDEETRVNGVNCRLSDPVTTKSNLYKSSSNNSSNVQPNQSFNSVNNFSDGVDSPSFTVKQVNAIPYQELGQENRVKKEQESPFSNISGHEFSLAYNKQKSIDDIDDFFDVNNEFNGTTTTINRLFGNTSTIDQVSILNELDRARSNLAYQVNNDQTSGMFTGSGNFSGDTSYVNSLVNNSQDNSDMNNSQNNNESENNGKISEKDPKRGNEEVSEQENGFEKENTVLIIENKLNNILNNTKLSKYIYLNEIRYKYVIVRIYNYKPIISFNNLRSHTIGCIASVLGQVIRISKPKTLILFALFTCTKCDESFFKKFNSGIFTLPKNCINPCCNNKFFVLNKHYIITNTYQILRLQEYIIDDMNNVKTNSILDIQIMDDLIGMYNLGNILNIIGIIKINNEVTSFQNGSNNSLVYKLYLNTISVNIYNNNNLNNSKHSNYYKFINDIFYNESNRFYLIATSLFPNLKGHYHIKVGLLLSLFGFNHTGSNKILRNGNKVKRENIHVLLIGEPGVGKSHMLSCISSLGNHIVNGNNISNSGLNVGIIKDNNNEYNIEAGLLVLYNNSILCIDELDKLNSTNILLEVMEKQKVSIAKGGIIKTLNANTTLICALNPTHSKFKFSNENIIANNIKLSTSLLSRFDLIFLIINDKNNYYDKCDENNELVKKLKSFQKYDYLNNVLINEYIEYSKKYVNPKFTKEAKLMLYKFFKEILEMSNNNCDANGNPINSCLMKVTIRQLQGLIRLCKSRARGDLLNVITVDHVKDVIEIFKNTIYYPLYTVNQNIVDPGLKPAPVKKCNILKIFLNEIRMTNMETMSNGMMRDIARDLIEKNNLSMDPDELIYKGKKLKSQLRLVNNMGYILKDDTSWKINI